MTLYHSGMVDYARARYAEGEHLCAAHRGDATGCCARCGREALCPDAIEGERLQRLYGAWLNTEPPAIEPMWIRPYVRNTGTW